MAVTRRRPRRDPDPVLPVVGGGGPRLSVALTARRLSAALRARVGGMLPAVRPWDSLAARTYVVPSVPLLMSDASGGVLLASGPSGEDPASEAGITDAAGRRRALVERLQRRALPLPDAVADAAPGQPPGAEVGATPPPPVLPRPAVAIVHRRPGGPAPPRPRKGELGPDPLENDAPRAHHSAIERLLEGLVDRQDRDGT
jgi:hypothetical protein